MDVVGKTMELKFKPEYRDAGWVATALESAPDPLTAGAHALMAAVAVAPVTDLGGALAGALPRSTSPAGEVASTVAALRAGGDLRAECMRLAGVLSRLP